MCMRTTIFSFTFYLNFVQIKTGLLLKCHPVLLLLNLLCQRLIFCLFISLFGPKAGRLAVKAEEEVKELEKEIGGEGGEEVGDGR